MWTSPGLTWIRAVLISVLLITLAAPVYAGDPWEHEGPPCWPESQPGEGPPFSLDNPVYLPRGEKLSRHVDLFLPGRGLDIQVERRYRARGQTWFHDTDYSIFQLPLGSGWSHNYQMWIMKGGGHGVDFKLLTGDEKTVFFRYDLQVTNGLPQGGGIACTADHHHSALVYKDDDTEVTYTTGDGTVYTFSAFSEYESSNVHSDTAFLKQITDRNGNSVYITYQTPDLDVLYFAAPRIHTVSDDIGNVLTFSYYDDANAPRPSGIDCQTLFQCDQLYQTIWKIKDQTGREVEYVYEFGQAFGGLWDLGATLIEAKLPSNGDVEPDRSITYDYWKDTQGRMTALLKSVTSPNGDVRTENFYGKIGLGLSDWERRVYKQIRNGDTYTHMLTFADGEAIRVGPTSTATNDFCVWVQKRNGSITRLEYTAKNDTRGRYRLMSRTDYPGLVPQAQRGKLVWFDSTAGSSGVWYWADDPSGVENPTTFSGPGGQKRAGDTSVTTLYEYNKDWHVTKETRPNGDVIEYTYTTGTDIRSRGALLSKTIKPAGTVLDGFGNPLQTHSEWIIEQYEHDFSLNGSTAGCGCGSGAFPTAMTDGEGHRTESEYSAVGDLEKVWHDIPSTSTSPNDAKTIEEFTYWPEGQLKRHTHGERIVWDDVAGQPSSTPASRTDYYQYYASGVMKGRLKSITIDEGGLNLITEFEYNALGDMAKKSSPEGHEVHYVYNEHHELVKKTHYNSNKTVAVRVVDYWYDANGNVVRMDEGGSVGEAITTLFEYDIVNNLIAKSVEITGFSPSMLTRDAAGRYDVQYGLGWVTEEWDYDANDNMIAHRYGDYVSGAFDIEETYEYDFRDLLYEKRIEDSATGTKLVTQYAYDANGRVSEITHVDTANSTTRSWQFTHDPFDRLHEVIDPMGNTVSLEYDDNHNLIERTVVGVYDYTSSTPATPINTALSHTAYTYDSRDRLTSESVTVFNYLSTTPSGTSVPTGTLQTTTYTYNANDSILAVDIPSASGSGTTTVAYTYDTADRLAYIADEQDNWILYEYDDDSNMTSAVWTDVVASTAGGSPSTEVFVMDYIYDSLDRRILSFDGAGNINAWYYDARSNLTKEVNGRGNYVEYQYDGLNRRTQSSRPMDINGQNPDLQDLDPTNPYIVESAEYDDAGRLVKEIDDNGNEASYTYDDMGRLIETELEDTSKYSTVYDDYGQATAITDARGVVISQAFDDLGRVTSRTMTNISVGPLAESFRYDGLGRIISAANYSDLSMTTPIALVDRVYDSRGYVLRETQNSRGTSRDIDYAFDDAGNNTLIAYPSGRKIARAYDNLNRLASIEDQTDTDPANHWAITSFDYIGGRLGKRLNGNGTSTEIAYTGQSWIDGNPVANSPGDYGFSRVSGMTTKDPLGAVIDAQAFTWDKSQNKAAYEQSEPASYTDRRNRIFAYDSAERLVESATMFQIGSSEVDTTTAYTLDGVHNRTEASVTPAGFEIGNEGAPDGPSVSSELNQLVTSPRESDADDWAYHYDANGNMTAKYHNVVIDFDGDYQLNFGDVSAFLTHYGNQDPAADLNGDGVINYADNTEFLNLYAQYTAGGNGIENWQYTYDFRNQLIGILHRDGQSQAAGSIAIVNTYDPFARRVRELSTDSASTTVTDMEMVYGCRNLWEVLERIEHTGPSAEALRTTHVYGLGIDDEVSYRVEDLITPEDFWTHRDDQGSLTSLTNGMGAVVERYTYGDYGNVVVLDPAGSAIYSESQYGSIHLYAGRARFTSSKIHDVRRRVLDSNLGRFLQRDPLWHHDALNLSVYVIGNPHSFTDPLGMRSNDPFERFGVNGDFGTRTGKYGFYAKNRTSGQKELTRDVMDLARGDFRSLKRRHIDNPCSPIRSLLDKNINAGLLVGSLFLEPLDMAGGVLATLKDPSDPLNWASIAPVPMVPGAAIRQARMLGKAGEDAVRAAHDIGDKQRIVVNGRNRVPDGLTNKVISEVKNTGRVYFTRQLRDYAEYASQNNLRFDLYIRPGVRPSTPLQEARDAGLVNILPIP